MDEKYTLVCVECETEVEVEILFTQGDPQVQFCPVCGAERE